MSTQESIPRSQPQLKLVANRVGSKRGRLLLNLGCVPAVVIVILAVLLALNVFAFLRAPSWVTDPRAYLVSGRLILSVGTVLGIEILATWSVGLLAALMGVKAAAGQGSLLLSRLEVIRRRIAITAWGIVAIRLVLLGGVVIAVVYLYTELFGFRLAWGVADDAWTFVSRYPVVAATVVAVGVTQLLIGPLLRLRYSLALGALAGTWTRNRDQRPWLALALRLGMGLAGLLALLWGSSGGHLLIAILFDPAGYPNVSQYPQVFSQLPPRAASVAVLATLATGILLVHTVMQVVLTSTLQAAARARLARPRKLDYYVTAGSTFRELARTSGPSAQRRS